MNTKTNRDSLGTTIINIYTDTNIYIQRVRPLSPIVPATRIGQTNKQINKGWGGLNPIHGRVISSLPAFSCPCQVWVCELLISLLSLQCHAHCLESLDGIVFFHLKHVGTNMNHSTGTVERKGSSRVVVVVDMWWHGMTCDWCAGTVFGSYTAVFLPTCAN